MIIWLDNALVLAMHDRQLAEHGGSGGVRDDGLLESALARPQQLHAYGQPAPGLTELAASLAFGLARNHPFVDGNKRTAYTACRTFLKLNDADLNVPAAQRYDMFVKLGEGIVSEEELAAWLRLSCVPVGEGNQLQESPARYASVREKGQLI